MQSSGGRLFSAEIFDGANNSLFAGGFCVKHTHGTLKANDNGVMNWLKA